MKVITMVMFVLTALFVPTVAQAQDIESVPEPPQYEINMNFTIFVDFNSNEEFDGNDVVANNAIVECYEGGAINLYVANSQGKLSITSNVYEGDSIMCNFYYTQRHVMYVAGYALLSIHEDNTYNKTIPLQQPAVYLPVAMR